MIGWLNEASGRKLWDYWVGTRTDLERLVDTFESCLEPLARREALKARSMLDNGKYYGADEEKWLKESIEDFQSGLDSKMEVGRERYQMKESGRAQELLDALGDSNDVERIELLGPVDIGGPFDFQGSHCTLSLSPEGVAIRARSRDKNWVDTTLSRLDSTIRENVPWWEPLVALRSPALVAGVGLMLSAAVGLGLFKEDLYSFVLGFAIGALLLGPVVVLLAFLVPAPGFDVVERGKDPPRLRTRKRAAKLLGGVVTTVVLGLLTTWLSGAL